MVRTGTRRGAWWASALVIALLVGVVVLRGAAPPARADDHPLAFGAFPQPQPGQTAQQAVQQLEGQIGRSLAIVRVFETWEDEFPDGYHRWLRDTDHTLILSVKPSDSDGPIAWTSIASAAPGSTLDQQMRSWARHIRDFGVPIWVTFNHEPEAGNGGVGTDAEFIAAWRTWVDIFRQEGATNVKHMWIVTDYAFHVPTSDRRHAPDWYPGDDWVDGIAIDAYNWHVCRPNADNVWKSLATIIEPFRRFALAHPSEEVWLAEWASWEDPQVPNRKAQWIEEARDLFAQPAYAQFDGVVYFHSRPINQEFVNCDWRVTTTSSSLAEFRAMALDPRYGLSTTTPPTTTTPSTVPPPTTPAGPTTTLAPGPPAPPGPPVGSIGAVPASASAPARRMGIPDGVQHADAMVVAPRGTRPPR